jgi:hypothetical protein
MRSGEENSVQIVLEKVPPKMELGAASEANSSQTFER